MREAALFIAGQGGLSETGLLHKAVRALRQAVRSWRDRKRVAKLTDFDDRMLADIGLTSTDVREALHSPFPGHELELRAIRNRRRGWNV